VQFTYKEMVSTIEAQSGPLTRMADPRGEVAKNFTLPGFQGSVAFVTSMTENFCSDCNRIRLMADGNLKVCLFGANEVSLRDAMRDGATDGQLQRIISAAVKRKRFAHADMDVLAATKNRAMIKIGG
jgi:GTP 3',8-cyclase